MPSVHDGINNTAGEVYTTVCVVIFASEIIRMQNLSVDSSDSAKLNMSSKHGGRSSSVASFGANNRFSFGINNNQSSQFSVQEPKAEIETSLPCNIEKEPGLKVGCENGFYGPNKTHILTFDQSKVRT